MIWRLAREQLRSQWRYTAWSAGLLAFALALATYAMVTGATAIKFQESNGTLLQKDYSAFFTSVVGPGDVSRDLGEVPTLPFDEVQKLISDVPDEVAVEASVNGVGRFAGTSSGDWLTVVAVTPDSAVSRQIASGTVPAHGQIVISDAIARERGLGVGDAITLETVDDRGPKQSMTFVISGTAKFGAVAPYWSGDPFVAYVPWSDARDVALGLPTYRATDDATGDVTTVIWTLVGWNGNSGALAPYAQRNDYAPFEYEVNLGNAAASTDAAGYWAFGFAALTVLGMIVAAFGMGRAQAEARTKWAATTRVLGATRLTVAAASLIETAAVSLAGIAVGMGVGVAGVAVNIGILHARHPEALLPSGPSVPAILLAAGLGVGIVVAAVVAAVPAFWSARVAPVAALKPVTPVGEARVSRDVSPWWVPGIFAAGLAAWCVLFWFYERGERSDSNPITVALWISFVVIAISGLALVVEGSRALIRGLGRALSRSRRPWLIAAGDGLSAHRGVFAFASLGMFALATVASWVATSGATNARAYDPSYRGWGEPPLPSFDGWWRDQLGWDGYMIAIAMFAVVITVVAIVVTVSSRATFAGDAATRSALGLSANGERVASAVRQWIVMGSSSLAGALTGWTVALVTRLAAAALSPNELVYSWHWNVAVAGYGLAAVGLVAAVTLAITLAGSLVVGLLARPRTPVDALRRAAG